MSIDPVQRLFHFSENPAIDLFQPRPVAVPATRPPGRDWLNGPLVWAIDGPHAFLYLFPRECPRILLWPTGSTSQSDRRSWIAEPAVRGVAYVLPDWLPLIRAASLYRYELPCDHFEDLDDAGMHVSRTEVCPIRVDRLTNLTSHLAASNIDLRVIDDFAMIGPVWNTTLHVSGIRLRNAGKPPAQ